MKTRIIQAFKSLATNILANIRSTQRTEKHASRLRKEDKTGCQGEPEKGAREVLLPIVLAELHTQEIAGRLVVQEVRLQVRVRRV